MHVGRSRSVRPSCFLLALTPRKLKLKRSHHLLLLLYTACGLVAQVKEWVEGVVKAEGRRQDDSVAALKELKEQFENLSRGGKENEARVYRIEQVMHSSNT